MSRGVILGQPDPPIAHRIYVPAAYAGERTVIGRCNVCGTEFYSGEAKALEHHVAACWRRNEAEILAAAPSRNRTIEPPDPEVEAHLRKVGRRMRSEGRWELHDNERAGFS